MKRHYKTKRIYGMTIAQIITLVSMAMISCLFVIILGGVMMYYSYPGVYSVFSILPTITNTSRPKPTATYTPTPRPSSTPVPTRTSTPTLSPMQDYAQSMQIPLEDLTEWTTNGAIRQIINDQVPGWQFDGKNISYGDGMVLLAFYSTLESVPPAKLSSSKMSDFYSDVADVIRPELKEDQQTGFDILVSWSTVIPPSSIQTEHEQIISCIQDKINAFSALNNWFEIGGDLPEIDTSQDSLCNYYDQNLNTIKTFVFNYLP